MNTIRFEWEHSTSSHHGPRGMVETLYRGGKGDFTEGGVRVPAIAWWHGRTSEKVFLIKH